jgi:tRNA (guanine-N7-)-methyltransferase
MQHFWPTIFGSDRPVELEIGPGTGVFILGAASTRSDTNFFGVERSPARAARLEAAIRTRALPNVRIVAADAACLVPTLIPPDSVSAYHIYFPDPWWKRRHHRRRLFTSSFAAALARTLVPGGRLHVATDVDDTFGLILETLAACGALARRDGACPPREVATVFERKGLTRGATIKEASFVKWVAELSSRAGQVSNAAPITPAESPS